MGGKYGRTGSDMTARCLASAFLCVDEAGLSFGVPAADIDSEMCAQLGTDARFQPVVRPERQIARDEADVAAAS